MNRKESTLTWEKGEPGYDALRRVRDENEVQGEIEIV